MRYTFHEVSWVTPSTAFQILRTSADLICVRGENADKWVGRRAQKPKKTPPSSAVIDAARRRHLYGEFRSEPGFDPDFAADAVVEIGTTTEMYSDSD